MAAFSCIHIATVLLLLLSSPVVRSSSSSRCIDFERESLIKLKDGLSDPSDRLWSWIGDDCCRWSGITCSTTTGNVIKLSLRNHGLGGQISSSSLVDLKHLSYLDLSSNEFEGTPVFVASITTLQYLNLSSAFFGGFLPPNLGNLTSLRYLDLNSISSKEKDLHWLPFLTSLRYLHLGSVDLTLAKAQLVGVLNMLPFLQQLHLPACGLSTLPLVDSAVNLTSPLSVLDLSNNGFNSSIPRWIFNLTSLTYLDLSSNDIHTSSFPDEFAQLKLLKHLDLSENSFIQGTLPKTLGKLCQLQLLDLSFNKITGEIAHVIDAFSQCSNTSDLQLLQLGYNNLHGNIPTSLGKLANLKYLLLTGNSFSGSIPQTIGNLSSLQQLYLSTNLMTGTIPDSLGKLSNLVFIDISANQWTGVITHAHFSNLTALKELSIVQTSHRVTLFFNITPHWIPPFKLSYLNLKSCKLGPGFPQWLRNQTDLESVSLWRAEMSGNIPKWFWDLDLSLNELDLSYNQLTGSVPNTIRFNPQAIIFLTYNLFSGPLPLLSANLSSLHLDNNMFSGPIPEDIGTRMPQLVDVDLSFNSLNGTIPCSIGKSVSLFTFVVSNNQLSGKIPDCWSHIPDIYVIDMSNNSLSGDIPNSFGSLSQLKFLTLSNNLLSGKISSILGNCTNMETLKLGDNRISGTIAEWIGEKMPLLLILSLRSNLLSGNIPAQLCNLSSLHIMDIAHNNLSGSIPACVGDLSGMAFYQKDARYEGQFVVPTKGKEYFYEGTLYLVNSIDLSGNRLSGKIPEFTENLSKLGILNLSMNHLKGNIPESISRLGNLETLDLSKNQLSGQIPTVMASMTSLNHLNLSYNNLSGKIPTANQFSTFSAAIYEGNAQLCGLPLQSKCNGGDETSKFPGAKDDEDGDHDDNVWLYISMGPGFVVGFWAVCGPLILRKSWRITYYNFIDDIKERLRALI